jgi:hypothetical protein
MCVCVCVRVCVTHISIARQRLRKHISEAYAVKNRRTSIARQRTHKHAFLTTEDSVSPEVHAEEL